jgi:FKBP-type peptidyl-prolyl cis-trans isomerase
MSAARTVGAITLIKKERLMKPRHVLYLAILPLLVTACQKAPEQEAAPAPAPALALETDAQVYSYGVGFQIGSQMASSPVEMDTDGLIAGLKDALAQTEPQVDQGRLQEVAQRLQGEMQAKQEAETEVLGAENATAAAAYMAENAAKDGVVVLENGLQYRVIESAEGEKPAETDTVVVNYRGTFIDGTEFDSSYGRGEPAQFPLNAVIPGWQQALQMMSVGSKWEVVIPPELAYGPGGQGPIPPSSALVFEVELLEINPAPAEAAEVVEAEAEAEAQTD